MTKKPTQQTEDPQKAKFREALERKKGTAAKPAASKHGGPEHAHGEHGPEGGKRQFRRKSGG